MKININFLFFAVILIALSTNAHSGLVTGIIGKIHDTIHKVQDDVHNILKPKEKDNQSQTSNNSQRESKLSYPDTAYPNNEKRDDNDKIIFATMEAPANEKVVNNNDSATVTPAYDVRQKVEVKESTTEEVFVFASSPSTPSPVPTTTKKDGRENFAAGCSTGYKRTADGRCKPTF